METGRAKIHLDLRLERMDSIFVPWSVVEDNSHGEPEYFKHSWRDDLSIIETNTWDIGVDVKDYKIGEVVHINSGAFVIFTKCWTDCGYEYDAQLELV